MLKLNIFSYVYWPEQFLINEMAEDIVQRGYEINVLTGLPNYPKGDFYDGFSLAGGPYLQEHKGVKIRRYPIFARKTGFPRLMMNYISHLLGALSIKNKIPQADWAFVFATSPITTAIPAIFWARRNKAKVCIWLQDLWPDSVAAVGATNRNSILYKILGKMVAWIYKNTDLILIQSPGFADNLKEFGYKGPSHVIPNWAPGLDFKDATVPSWLNDLPAKFTVTFAGNVGKAQAIDTVIEAAKILKDKEHIQFLVVGDGSELERVRGIARAEDLQNVQFYGRKPIEDMPGLFKRSDALLVSLKKDPIFARTIPSKVQAYMAAGKPLVGSLDGVGSQVIQEAQAGFTAPAENSTELAGVLLKMAELTDVERQKLGDNARHYFSQNYEKGRIISHIIEHLERYK